MTTKRRRLKEEPHRSKAEVKTENEDRRSALQTEISRIVDDARRSFLGEKPLEKILESLNRSLIKNWNPDAISPSSLQECRHYATVLGMDAMPSTNRSLTQSITLLSRLEYRTQLKETAVRCALPLPKEIFDEKDYLDCIYFWKKFRYLATTMQSLSCCKGVEDVEIEFQRGDVRSPVVRCTYSTASSKLKLCLVPVLSSDVFPYRRFLLERNNVRGFVDGDGDKRPTPGNNLRILSDVMVLPNIKYCEEVVDAMPQVAALYESVTLLQIWLRRHALNTIDGFDDIAWMVCIIRAIQKGLIVQASSLGTFYSILSVLLSSKFTKLTMRSESVWDFASGTLKLLRDDKALTPEEFRKLGMEYVADVTGGYNLAWDVSKSWMEHLQSAAERTMKAISKEGSFDGGYLARELLENDVPLPALFDCVMKIDVPESKEKHWDSPPERLFVRRLEAILSEALSDRCTRLRYLYDIDIRLPRSTTGNASFASPVRSVYICLALNGRHAWRTIDKGPSCEDKSASRKFRRFWGEKSAMKKFQDGSVCEAVSWEMRPGHKHEMIDRIVTYILQKHLGLAVTSVTSDIALLFPRGHLEAQLLDVRRSRSAVEDVASLLKNLKGLPLSIASVQEIDPSGRRTACFQTAYHPLADDRDVSIDDAVHRCLDPIQLMLSLETSGSWPVHKEAVLKTKVAMYSQLSKGIRSVGHRSMTTSDFVDCFFHGFVFRLFIITEQEEKEGCRLTTERRYHNMIKTSVDRHPMFATTVRLLKRWMSTHLMDFHFDERIVELLTVYVYETSTTDDPPSTALTGFFRVMHLISTYPWFEHPLIVDIEQDLTDQDRFSIARWYSTVKSHRSIVICTSFDRMSSLTEGHPHRAILKRLQYLTGRCCQSWMHPLKQIFSQDSLSGFDVLLHLHEDAVPRPERSMQDRREPTSEADEKLIMSRIPIDVYERFGRDNVRSRLLVGFDPVRALWKTLSERFGYVALFCCDRHGTVMGIHWNPDYMKPSDRPNVERLSNWKREEEGYVPDIASILMDIELLGRGMIQSIEIP